MIEAAGSTNGAVYSMSSKSSTLGDSVSPGSEDFSREAYHGSASPPSVSRVFSPKATAKASENHFHQPDALFRLHRPQRQNQVR